MLNMEHDCSERVFVYIKDLSCVLNAAKTEAVVRRCSVKKGVVKNFVKFTGTHLCARVSFLIQLQASNLQLTKLQKKPTKKRLWHMCFPVNFAKFLTAPFIIEHLWWLLLLKAISCYYRYFKKYLKETSSCCTFLLMNCWRNFLNNFFEGSLRMHVCDFILNLRRNLLG